MTRRALLLYIRSTSLYKYNIPLSLKEAREVAVDNGLMTNSSLNGKLTTKGEAISFKNLDKVNNYLDINYHKLAINEFNKLFE